MNSTATDASFESHRPHDLQHGIRYSDRAVGALSAEHGTSNFTVHQSPSHNAGSQSTA